MEDINVAFDGCERYITVDFPAPSDNLESPASAKSRRNEKLRASSLKRLGELLDEFMLPSTIPCLRATMKKGRVLVMGAARNARNMIAKLLVDGTLDETSASCVKVLGPSSSTQMLYSQCAPWKSPILSDYCGYEELEGRGWQVVNASALDKESVTDVYKASPTSMKIAIRKMSASKLNAVLHHGTYSHCVYVDDCENEDVVDGMVPKEVISILQQVHIKHTIAVIVNAKLEDVQHLEAEKYKEWGIVCHLKLPSICKSPDMEREPDEIFYRSGLGILEQALCATPAYVNTESHSRIPPQKSTRTGEIYNNSFNTLANTFKALKFQDQNKIQVYESTGIENVSIWSSTNVTVFKLPFKRIVAELQYKPSNVDIPIEGLYIFVHKVHRSQSIFSLFWPWSEYTTLSVLGNNYSESQWIWGELQILDKHHIDKKIERLPCGRNCETVHYDGKAFGKLCDRFHSENHAEKFMRSTGMKRNSDIWYIGNHDAMERNFISNISYGDTIVLWMNSHPWPSYYSLSTLWDTFAIQFGWTSSAMWRTSSGWHY